MNIIGEWLDRTKEFKGTGLDVPEASREQEFQRFIRQACTVIIGEKPH